MSDFIDRYERQLVDAARRRIRAHGRARRWLSGRPRRAGLLAAAAIAIAAPAGAATLGWDPFADTARDTPAPSTSNRPPTRDLVDMLAVLRRPQTERDRGPLAERALRGFDRDVAGVQLRYVRTLREDHDVVLVPVERFGLIQAALAARHPELPRVPLAERSNAVCVYLRANKRSSGRSCLTATEIRTGHALASAGSIVYGLVPDGVADVRLTSGSGKATDVPVRDNFFASDAAPTAPTSVAWLDGHGHTFRTIGFTSPPTEQPPPSRESKCVTRRPGESIAHAAARAHKLGRDCIGG